MAGIAVYESSEYKSCAYEHSGYKKQNKRPATLVVSIKNPKLFFKCTWFFAYENHGPLTAVATFFLAIFTTTLWWVTRRVIQHAPQIERAYVSGGATIQWEETGEFKHVRGIGTSAVTKPITKPRWLIITVDNYGKTPAYVSHIAVGICPIDELPKPANLPADYERSKMLVKMNVKPGTEGHPTNLHFEFRECRGKIVYGRFYYTDIFGKGHSSGFILRVTNNNTVAHEAPPEYTAWD